MSWFRRKEKSISTTTAEKRNTPEGLWYKIPSGKHVYIQDLQQNAFVDDEGNHLPISSQQYFELLFDKANYKLLFDNIISTDALKFFDLKAYPDRLKAAKAKTGLKDAISVALGKSSGRELVIAAMDFGFIGGSMGSVVGEKIIRAIDHCCEQNYPLLIISKSGGARMQEASLSLMQLPKIVSRLNLLADAKVPYISLMTHPTMGGVTASFAMLGDFNLAEPKALIGFAGPRVIRETMGKDLPPGFQSAEFLLEHGFLDRIVNRKELKKTIDHLLSFIYE